MTSLQDILIEHRIPFQVGGEHRNVRDGYVGVDCPFCGSGTGRNHLGINIDTLYATCWQCGRKDLGEVLGMLLDVPTPQAWGLLKDVPKRPRIHSKGGLSKGVLSIPPRLQSLLQPHQGYLRGRGFDPVQLARLWDLSALGMAPRLAWRIFIPVHLDGEIVSWTTRSIGRGRSSKYVHADPSEEAWPIKSLLYGWDYVRHSAIVCEGPADVWRIGPGAVAIFGLNVTTAQLELLSNVPRRIVCLDNEERAQKTARKICEQLSCWPGETVNVCLNSSDPGCATEKEIEKLRRLLKE